MSDLTNIDRILYLLHQEENKMKGRIRPISIHSKCSICGKLFQEIPKLGYICKTHDKMPRKFFIDLWHDGIRYKIFSDKYDNILDSYSFARTLHKQINIDIANKTFYPAHYVKKEREKYYISARWEVFVDRYQNPKYLNQLKYAKNYIFKYFAASHDIRNIQQPQISLFSEAVPSMSKKGLTKKSVKNIVGVLLSFINYHYGKGLVSSKVVMPDIPVKLLKKSKKIKFIPELSESLKIISFIPTDLRIIFLFLVTHLCRPADARALQAKHFNFTDNTVTIEQGFSCNQLTTTKTDNPYTIPIHVSIIDRLQATCISKMPDDFVFTYKGNRWAEAKLREIWNEAVKKAGSKVTLYQGVKHASISHCAGESGDIYNTSKLTGHSDVRTTELYAKRNRIEKMRRVQETIVIPSDLL